MFGFSERNFYIAYILSCHKFWAFILGRVESHHFLKDASRPLHILNTGKAYTWRSGVYHDKEAFRDGQWGVSGYLFFYPDGNERLDVMTGVSDCSIYDGWWD